jgi:hypothetical protein
LSFRFSNLIAVLFLSATKSIVMTIPVYIIISFHRKDFVIGLYNFILPFFVLLVFNSINMGIDFIHQDKTHKEFIKKRSLETCINEIEKIREHTDSAIGMLESEQAWLQKKYPDNEKKWAWIEKAIEFNQKFASLAASEDTTPEQAEAHADEVKHFVKQNKLKYPYIFGENLADLIRERNLKTKKAKQE